ncbi:MAG: carbamoyl-phosphate synthase large subunit, partial [Candidatus Omnitrophota bacterium]
TSMKSVGETMAIGRTFKEALQKGLRGLEIGEGGLTSSPASDAPRAQTGACPGERCVRGSQFAPGVSGAGDGQSLRDRLRVPNAERVFYLFEAFRVGMDIDSVYELTRIDKWFLQNIREIIGLEKQLLLSGRRAIRNKGSKTLSSALYPLSSDILLKAKQYGFSDGQLARLWRTDEGRVRRLRRRLKIEPAYKLVDTCAAEFAAYTPYFYSTYDRENEVRRTGKKKIMVLGGGPNRIGQGIEFDYCCVHACFALKEQGYETIMVNSNPETVSTDYDISDKLYFEPLTAEDVLNICERERPQGVIVQFGGQTPLNLALPLQKAGIKIIGTSPRAIDIAEDREKFKRLLRRLGLRQPQNGTVFSVAAAKKTAARLGYPVLVRPSYVLGGRAMEIVYSSDTLEDYIRKALSVSGRRPVLIDKFLEEAIEVDVDMVADGETFLVGGILEHIEEAGVHSGDAAMVLPPYSLSAEMVARIKKATVSLARGLGVCGLMNVQYAIQGDNLFVLEVNPRASRTVPFISKATGLPLAKLAAKVMAGARLKDLGVTREVIPGYFSVKESVFPFNRFPGVDIMLGPEMRSTGEVMGIDKDFGRAFLKSQLAAGQRLPVKGRVFISVKDSDKPSIIPIARDLAKMGFRIVATSGTHRILRARGLACRLVKKLKEGSPNTLDLLKEDKIGLIINTPSGRIPRADEVRIRSYATMHNIPCVTTIAGARASVRGIESLIRNKLSPRTIQEYHRNAIFSSV